MSGASAGRIIRIGTRGSALALAQARLAADALASAGRAHEIVIVETEGDRRAPDTAWGEGAFVKAIEQALLDGLADIAVHSAKDVPTDEDPRLAICCYLPREDPLDALVVAAGDGRAAGIASVDELPAGSVVGTDSPRRTGFLRSRRADIEVRPLHGNVDTRLRRLDGGQADALVLAAAGLRRLGRDDRISQRIPAEVLPPAPGQGAIALQVRASDGELLELGKRLDHRPTRLTVEIERAFLRAAGGGCRAPLGALAELIPGERLRLLGGFALPRGGLAVVEALEGPIEAAADLAEELAERLSSTRGRLMGGPRVLLTRQPEQSQRLAARLAERGLRGLVVPAIEIAQAEPGGALDAAVEELPNYSWTVVTSANGARAVIAAAQRRGRPLKISRWATVGRATARQLQLGGATEIWLPETAGGEALAETLPVEPGERVLLVRGDLADETVPGILRGRGAQVDEVIAYRTLEAPERSRAKLAEALAGGALDALVFASPSAVRGLLRLADTRQRVELLAVPAVCIGATTAAAARGAGFTILGHSETQDAEALAALTAELLGREAGGVPA